MFHERLTLRRNNSENEKGNRLGNRLAWADQVFQDDGNDYCETNEKGPHLRQYENANSNLESERTPDVPFWNKSQSKRPICYQFSGSESQFWPNRRKLETMHPCKELVQGWFLHRRQTNLFPIAKRTSFYFKKLKLKAYFAKKLSVNTVSCSIDYWAGSEDISRWTYFITI